MSSGISQRHTEACAHADPVTHAWRRAGWHDADMESGVRKFQFRGDSTTVGV